MDALPTIFERFALADLIFPSFGIDWLLESLLGAIRLELFLLLEQQR